MSEEENTTIDSELIMQKITELEKYLNVLKEIATMKKSAFSTDMKAIYASERLLQVSIECMLDIGNHIVSRLALGKPASYREIVEKLVEEHIIPENFGQTMVQVVAFRNRLVHRDSNLDTNMVYDIIHKALVDFPKFAHDIAKILE